MTVVDADVEVARLRSIIHRAEAAAMSYDTRTAIAVLRELNEASDRELDEPVAPTSKHRILWNDRGHDIDEIVLHDVRMIHVEQNSDRCWWIGINLPGDGYWAGNFIADSRGRMRFNEQEIWGFDWDRDDEHMQPGGAA